MELGFCEEEAMLATSVRGFIEAECPVSRLRELRGLEHPLNYCEVIWGKMIELGWLSMVEASESRCAALANIAIVAEEMGRSLCVEPFVSTAVGGVWALAELSPKGIPLYPRLSEGSAIVAHGLGLAKWDSVQKPATGVCVDLVGGEECLNGELRFVDFGSVADYVLLPLSFSHSDEVGIGLVSLDEARVERIRLDRVDGRNAAHLRFSQRRLRTEEVLIRGSEAVGKTRLIFDALCVAAASEMLGAAQGAFDRTLDYLKTREQFGAPIGALQALQHRAARMFVEIQLARSAVRSASLSFDDGDRDRSCACSMAKVLAGEALWLVAKESVQMHGGIGMTDECDIGFYLKRALVMRHSLGDETFHRSRWSALRQY